MERKVTFFKSKTWLREGRSKATFFKIIFIITYWGDGREPLMWDRIMKMGDIEKGFYALLHVSVLADQTEGISNKYRMPQKCTLPRRGWGGPGPGSAHLNTIFIMPWPHKVISLEFWWLARTCCQVQLSKRGMISPNGSLAPSFFFILSLSNTQFHCQ